MILVTGATGTNGVALIRRLAAQGVPVRALVRNPAKAAPVQLPGVEIVTGDLADPASLAAAMRGVEKLFLLTANVREVVELNQNAIDAALEAGVGQVLRFSVLGADSPVRASFLQDAGEIDRRLAASGLNYTILRPNSFYQNALTSLAPTIAASDTFYLPCGEGKISQVDVRDIAAVAAAILTAPGTAHYGQIYELTGPQALSYDEVAAIYGEVLGRPVRYVDTHPEDYRQTLLSVGLPEWFANDLIALDLWYKDHGAAVVTGAIAQVTGRQPTSYREFVESHRAAFMKEGSHPQ